MENPVSEVQEDSNNLNEAALENKNTDTAEEYKYLKRNEFTSEIYKIELRGLKYFGVGELKKLLRSKFELDATKIKCPNGGKEFAFICFRTAEHFERALKSLNGFKWKGKILQAHVANASPDPLVVKRRKDEHDKEKEKDTPASKKTRTSIEATVPLAHLPYEQQLQQKEAEMQALMLKFKKSLVHTNSDMQQHLKNFEFLGLTPSPQVNGYRNKNEFTIGKNAKGETVVGFRLGSYSDGSTEVSNVDPDKLPHLPEAAAWAAQSFQQFIIKNAAELELAPFNPEHNSGQLKQLMVRTVEKTKEIMLVVGVYSTNMTAENLTKLKCRLKAYYFTDDEQKDAKFRCTSLFYQDMRKLRALEVVHPVEHLAGTEHITDEILGLRFRISPLAFFQVNTFGAELLYKHAIEFGAPKSNTYVLDICCGTGTIGLAFAKLARRVLGVDIVPDAIVDAGINAANNNITNVRFVAGDANDFIGSLVKEAVYDCPVDETLDILAIVDPPRNGLHNRSISVIRASTEIKRLVYISCKPERGIRNWLDLCRPESKQYKGAPFYPCKAVAVDMFPHTNHTEVVMLFERTQTTTTTTTTTTD